MALYLHSMLKRFIFVSWLLMATNGLAQAQTTTEVAKGLQWLGSQVQANGELQNESLSIATRLQNRSEVAQTLQLLSPPSPQQLLDGLIVANDGETEYLSRKILSHSLAGKPAPNEVNQLISRQGLDGGFGIALGYESHALDTAWALLALKNSTPVVNDAVISSAVDFLRANQQTNGAFGLTNNASQYLTTSVAMIALQSVARTPIVLDVLNKASAFLLSQQAADGGWGSVAQTSSVYLALLGSISDQGLQTRVTGYLLSQQSPDGSWGGDPYVTALALRVLTAQPRPVPTTGDITAQIVDASNGQALPNANVLLQGASTSVTLASNSQGRVDFKSVLAGAYNVTVSAFGYASQTRTFNLQAGTTVDLGVFSLQPAPTNGILQGVVKESGTGAVIPGVLVSVTGAATANATTLADGSYSIVGLTPGAVTVNASKNGYVSSGGTGTIMAGSILTFSPALQATQANSTTGSIVGLVKDGATTAPLAGVQITVTGAATGTALTSTNGTYSLTGLTPGAVTVTASLNGYISVSGSGAVSAGGVLTFSPSIFSVGQPPPTTSGIAGQVKDSVTGLPIVGVTINVTGSVTATTNTSSDGSFSLNGLAPGSVVITASKSGYASVNGAGTLAAGALVLFSPKLQNTAGTISGQVIDAVTKAPLAGVTISVEGGGITVTTTNDGRFTIQSFAGTTVQLKVQATGYQFATLQYLISPSQNLDVGQIRLSVPQVLPILPDLKVVSAKRVDAVTNPQTLQLSGSIATEVANVGNQSTPASVAVIAFSDVNRNNIFDEGIDIVLGQTVIETELLPNQTVNLRVNVAGVQEFRDAPIHVVVDPRNEIREASKSNNVRSTAQDILFVPSSQSFQPKLKWHWSGSNFLPSYNQVMMTPVVGRLLDTNKDGIVDERDSPVVVFTTFQGSGYQYAGVIRVVDGATGTELLSIVDNQDGIAGIGGLALADLDADGKPEIIGMTQNGKVIIFSNTGKKLWASINVFNNQNNANIWATPAVADLNGDGKPAIIVSKTVLNADGSLRWQGQGANCGCLDSNNLSVSVVSDLFATGKQNVVVGGAVYSSAGQLLWEGLDGFAAIGDFEGNGEPSIVVSGNNNYVAMYSRSGQLKWRIALPGGGGGPPTIADADGDGRVDIGIAGGNAFTVLRGDGSVLWSKSSQDNSSQITGSTFFDFDGDGSAEVLYADELKMRVFRGGTGELIWSIPNPSGTALEYPVVADLDNDGHADFIVVANNYAFSGVTGVRAFQNENNTWLPTRSVWNQHAYSINNINDDLTVPRQPVSSWQTHNTFRLNKRIDADPKAIADLTVGFLRVTDNGTLGNSTLTVRIGNAGSYKIPAGTLIAFYRNNPTLGTSISTDLIGITATNLVMEPGQFQDLMLKVDTSLINLSTSNTIWVVGDDNGSGNSAVSDFNRANNVISGNIKNIATNINISVTPNQPLYNETDIAIFTAPVTNAGSFARDVQVRFSVLDATGRLVEVLPLGSSIALAVGASVPVVQNWSVTGVLAGDYQVKAELITPEGKVYGSATANFSVQTSQSQTNTARITADRVSYSTAQLVQLTSRVNNTSANLVQDNVRAVTEVFGTTGQSVLIRDELIIQLSPASLRTYSYSLPASGLTSGSYQARLQLLTQQGVALAQSTTSFTVLSSEVTGVGLLGTISASPKEVNKGSNVSLTFSATNNGNSALTSIPLVVRIIDPALDKVIAEFPYQQSLIVGGSFVSSSNWVAAGALGTQYIATLSATVSGVSKTLAQDSFVIKSVVAPKLDIIQTTSTPALVLVLVSCKNKDEGHHDKDDDERSSDKQENEDNEHDDDEDHSKTCVSDRVNTITQELTALGVSHTVVTNTTEFKRAFRSGLYNTYWISGKQYKLHDDLADEIREAVFAGDRLILDGVHDERNKVLDQVAGITYRGKLGDKGLQVDTTGSLYTTQHLPVVGQALKVIANGGQAVAAFEGVGLNASGPAVLTNSYGQGKAIMFAFDYVSSLRAQALWKPVLADSLQYLLPIQSNILTPGALLPVKTAITNQGAATGIQVKMTLPVTAAVLGSNPTGVVDTATNSISWAFDLPALQTKDLFLTLRVPPTAGDFELQTRVSTVTDGVVNLYGDPIPLAFKVVTAAQNSTDVQAQLLALVLTSRKDIKLRQDLLSDLQNVMTAFNKNTSQGYETAIHEIIEMIEDMASSTAVNTPAIRLALDAILKEAQWRWSLLPTTGKRDDYEHRDHKGHR